MGYISALTYYLLRQIDVSAAIDKWLRTTYRSRYCTLCRLRDHSATFYVTNYDKPLHLFDLSCTVLCAAMAPCWLLTAPFYKVLYYTHSSTPTVRQKKGTNFLLRAPF